MLGWFSFFMTAISCTTSAVRGVVRILALRFMLKLSARPVLGVELALANPLRWAICSREGLCMGLSARLSLGVGAKGFGSAAPPTGLPNGLPEALASPDPPRGLAGGPKAVPRESSSGSIWAPPSMDLSLGEVKPGVAMSVSVSEAPGVAVRTCKLACAAAAKGDTSFDLGPDTKGEATLLADEASELADTAAAGSVPDAVAAAAARGGSADCCKDFLLGPPNLLLGGADANSSPPGMLGKPGDGLAAALLHASSGALSLLAGGGGALSGSGGGSELAWPATTLRLLYEWRLREDRMRRMDVRSFALLTVFIAYGCRSATLTTSCTLPYCPLPSILITRYCLQQHPTVRSQDEQSLLCLGLFCSNNGTSLPWIQDLMIWSTDLP